MFKGFQGINLKVKSWTIIWNEYRIFVNSNDKKRKKIKSIHKDTTFCFLSVSVLQSVMIYSQLQKLLNLGGVNLLLIWKYGCWLSLGHFTIFINLFTSVDFLFLYGIPSYLKLFLNPVALLASSTKGAFVFSMCFEEKTRPLVVIVCN